MVQVSVTKQDNGEFSIDLTYSYEARGIYVGVSSPLKGVYCKISEWLSKFSYSKNKCSETEDFWEFEGKVALGLGLNFEASNWDMNKDVEITGVEIGVGWAQFKTHTINLMRIFEESNDPERDFYQMLPYLPSN
jgi:hypothetical protein